MITVVLPTHDSAARLVQVLTVLVPAAVDGLVKAVVFADAGSTDATLDIAEDSGARVVQATGDAGTHGWRPAARRPGAPGFWPWARIWSLPEAWRTCRSRPTRRAAAANRPGSLSPDCWACSDVPLAVLAALEAVEAADGFKPGARSR
jgi:glycosyltransferase involved in cell wall biosynthesis